ncbi:MAG TPA: HEPN domain-containing protein [Candidatus Kapabacteria bacterium]|nr:HEPN domain-containing protein [Candidatus Kapabacteria bacterium]
MTPRVAEWLEKAEGDYQTAAATWKLEKPVYDTICYHYQQCVEKYFKAALLNFDRPVPKVHDLTRLSRELLPFISELETESEDLERLTNIASEVRYPGLTATEDEAKLALEICDRVKAIVQDHL